MLTARDSRVRLSAFEESPSQPRCTGSHPERMKPHHRPRLERTPLMLRAHIGSSRVREDLPRQVREVGWISAPAPRIVRPPSPTPVSYAGDAACGAVGESETSDLLEPRSNSVRLHRTPRIEIDQLDFGLLTRFFSPKARRPRLAGESAGFACGDEACSASSGGRIRRIRLRRRGLFGLVWAGGQPPAGPRRPADLATLAPARSQLAAREISGKLLPAADPPRDAASGSAAKADRRPPRRSARGSP
jgi:hypothetical protein